MKTFSLRPIASSLRAKARSLTAACPPSRPLRPAIARWNAATATAFAAASVVLLPPAAHAGGRPLTVDDAGINAPGEGEVEAWWEGTRRSRGMFVIAPSYTAAALPGLELDAALARDRDGRSTMQGASVKWLWTLQPEGEGCNAASSAGVTRLRHDGSARTGVLNLIGTCMASWGAAHGNLGMARAPHDKWQPTWGLALEGAAGLLGESQVTPMIETFGMRHGPTTVQTGLRWAWSAHWHVDGTIGRRRGDTVLSVGLRRGF
ncbi:MULTISPECIES: hypothetical protein [unclassified Acidovorax]|uniref:hypothetical protein n=1 Tax=unclassified Acidovorax TaxID=2684926 RepID=UPI002882E936|nr:MULTISPECIES: hypothetical protein [unclassified Acidovorax]